MSDGIEPGTGGSQEIKSDPRLAQEAKAFSDLSQVAAGIGLDTVAKTSQQKAEERGARAIEKAVQLEEAEKLRLEQIIALIIRGIDQFHTPRGPDNPKGPQPITLIEHTRDSNVDLPGNVQKTLKQLLAVEEDDRLLHQVQQRSLKTRFPLIKWEETQTPDGYRLRLTFG